MSNQNENACGISRSLHGKKVPGLYIVKFKEKFSDEKHGEKILKKLGAKIKQKFHLPGLDHFVSIELNDKDIEKLKKHDLIESIEQEEYSVAPSLNQGEGWMVSASLAKNFWNAGYTGNGIKVGMIDTGCNPHPDLPNLKPGWNVYNNTADTSDTDCNHGTRSAGVIGALNNSIGIKGIAYEADLYPIRCYYFDTDNCYTSASSAASGIQWAVTNQMDIILCNVQALYGSSILLAACNAAENAGIVVLAAAGNYPDPTGDMTQDTVRYPGHYDTVISVGALEETDGGFRRAPYSGHGPFLDIMSMTDQVSTTSSGTYSTYNGTSCATPVATGIMALYKQAYPKLTAAQLREKMYANVLPLSEFGDSNSYGRGMIQLPYSALPTPPTLTYPVISTDTVEDFSDTTYQFNINGDWAIAYDSVAGSNVFTHPAMTAEPSSTSSRFNFQVGSQAPNPYMNVRFRTDCEFQDKLEVWVNGVPRIMVGGKNPYRVRMIKLVAGQKYDVEIKYFKNESGTSGANSVWIDSLSIVMNGSVPVKPTLLTSDIGATYVFTNPVLSEDVTKYELFKNGTSIHSNSPETTHVVGDLTPGTTYNFHIIAENPVGRSVKSDTVSVMTAPSQPNLSVGSATSNSLTLTFSATGAANYDIYRNGSFLINKTSTTHTDSGLASNTKYNYYVIAKNSTGRSSVASTTQSGTTTTAGSPPSTPTISVGSPTTNSLTVTMVATGATSFDVYRSTSVTGTFTKVGTNVASPWLDNTGLNASTAYFYYVIAKNNYGNSSPSTTQSGTTLAVSTPGDSSSNPIVVNGTTATGTLQDTKDLYFKYSTPSTGSYTFTTSSSFDDYMQLLDANQNVLASDDDGAGSSHPKVVYTLNAGQIVYLKVYGYNHGAGKYGSVTLNVTPPPAAGPSKPTLVASSSTNTTITLKATGSADTTVYDFYKGSTKMGSTNGSTKASYIVSGLTAGTQYSFYVIAKNASGSSSVPSDTIIGTTSNT